MEGSRCTGNATYPSLIEGEPEDTHSTVILGLLRALTGSITSLNFLLFPADLTRDCKICRNGSPPASLS